jgi:hypothetical protein
MRIESSVTSISWIPSEAVEGLPRLPFELGMRRYDPPPPDTLSERDLAALRAGGRFRQANELKAWIEIEDGRVVGHGYSSDDNVGSTGVGLSGGDVLAPAVAFDVLRAEPDVRDGSARFVQTVGGRAGFAAPRRVVDRPFVRIQSPTVWTTLALTIGADGSSRHELVGASPFPRHWIYDRDGKLVQKTGLIDFRAWYREATDEPTPWGDEDSPGFVTQAETALERQISRWLMRGVETPARRTLASGETLVEQGDADTDLFLLLDGVLTVELDGKEVAEIGPGAVLGERAVLEGGHRTATLRARTRCRVAVVAAEMLDRRSLERLSASRADRQPAAD